VIVALVAALALDAVALGSDISYLHLIQRILRGESVSLASAAAADDRQTTIGYVQIAVFLVTPARFRGSARCGGCCS
jgi:hypothetical protein